jgi:excisionase family DNA binding protein
MGRKESMAAQRTITVEAAAKELGISRSSAFKAAHRGQIPVIVIGKRVLVLRRGLDELLEGKQPPLGRPQ